MSPVRDLGGISMTATALSVADQAALWAWLQ
jgi:hypothetical protein